MTQDANSDSNQDHNDNQVDLETDDDADHDPQNPWQTASSHPRKTTSGTKSQSHPPNFKHTKRKADNNKARLFMAKNRSLHTSVTKKKKPTTLTSSMNSTTISLNDSHNQSTQHQIQLPTFPTLIRFYNHF